MEGLQSKQNGLMWCKLAAIFQAEQAKEVRQQFVQLQFEDLQALPNEKVQVITKRRFEQFN